MCVRACLFASFRARAGVCASVRPCAGDVCESVLQCMCARI